jgi:4-amino-4-deoxy-L-arabinose transferase-like glycosyltransferase
LLPSNLAKRACLLLFLLIIAFYFYGLGYLPLMGPDEPRYAQVAREMFLRGDLITPTLAGFTWFEKPVLLYWMMEAAFSVFGISEAAARLGPAICGLLTLVPVYWIGKRVEQTSGDAGLRGLGCWSAIVLATMPGMIVFSRGVTFDIVITMSVTWSLGLFLLAQLEIDKRKRLWMIAGFYFFIGISLLAKGLIGIVLPFGVVALYQLFRRRLPDRQLLLSFFWGFPLALAVAAVWYGPVIAKHGWAFVDEFFIQHHFARYLSNRYGHPQPFPYYLVIIFPMALPWLVLAIDSLRKLRRWHWRGSSSTDQLRVFCFSWILFPLVFFTFSGSKLPGYILPILPALALMSAEPLTRFLRGRQPYRPMQVMAATMIVASLIGIAVAFFTRGLTPACVALVVAPLVFVGFLEGALAKRRFAAIAVAIGVLLSFTIALNCGLRAFVSTQTTKYLLDAAAARGYGSANVYLLHSADRGVEFYAANRLAYDLLGEPMKFEGAGQILNAAKPKKEPVLVIVPLKYVNQLMGLQEASAEVIGDNGSVAIVALKPR